MDERVMQFRVGVMVLATFLITAILVVIFGNHSSLVRPSYVVTIHFPSAPNVTRDTPVRKSGVLVGRVVDVELDETGVLVKAKIDLDPKRKINRTDIPHINPTLLGDTVIDFSPMPLPPSLQRGTAPVEIQSGDVIQGATVTDPLVMMTQMQSNVTDVISSVTRTSDEMGRLATRFNVLLDDNHGRISKMITDADLTMTAIRTTMNNFNDVVSDPVARRDLKNAVQQLPILFHEARETLGKLNGSFELVTNNLQNFQKFTQPLGERGPELVSHVNSVVVDLDGMVTQMTRFAQSLNNSQGTVGQLVNNPELYDNLNCAVRQINELTKELRPIINDARVFTDKIARHPESLGVRGALERNPGIK
jgi:phospholipid/cholesterol/gamma-HCH transport system substrate-binding protein